MTTRSLGISSPTRSMAVDAACVALTGVPLPRTAARERIVRAATVLWCRQLQPPTVRQVAAATGHRSFSGAVTPFGRCIDLHAAVIRTEWDLVARRWASAPHASRARWLADHARQLADVDPACLRLPGLVCSAVAAAGVTAVPPAELLVPLHALSALVRPSGRAVPDVAGAAAALADWSAASPTTAAPA